MSKCKQTKKALLSSVIALILCFSMLLGTTFAWFTDSVESGINKIQAGNLDIELYYSKDVVPEAIDANKVTAATDDLFTDENGEDILWEPGVVTYTNLNVVNEGSLALKYQFAINFNNENYIVENNAKLSQVLKVAFVEGGVTGTREQILNKAKESGVLLTDLVKSGYLDAGKNQVYGVVIYWEPSAIDNNWNVLNGRTTSDGKPLHIDLGVKLIATQKDAESDSFGPDYDEDAWTEGMKVYNAQDLQSAISNAQPGDVIELQNNIDLTKPLDISALAATTFAMRATPAPIIIDLNGNTLSGNVAKSVGHVINNAGNVVLKNGTISSVAENGGSAIYNAAGAALILENVTINGAPQSGDSWPSYAINNYGAMTINGAAVNSNHGAIAAYGDTVINDAEVTVNGCGKSSHVFYIGGEGTKVTVNGGTYTHKGNVDGSLAYIMTGTTMTVNGGTFSASNGGYGLATYTGSLIVNGGTFANAFLDWGGPISIAGGTFASKPADKYLADGYKAVENNGKYIVVADTIKEENVVGNAEQLKDALTNAGAAGSGDNTLVLSGDIDMSGTNWTPIKVDGYHGADIVTIEGNGATIKGLTAPLFAGGFAGGSGIVIKDLTIADSNIVSTNTTGSGAFIEYVDSMALITLDNCHLVNSTVTGGDGSRTGGLIGWTAGYSNVNDGPVKTYVTIKDCSVIGCTITCNGSVGGIYGHAGGNDWTYSTVENCVVKDNKLNSTDDGGWRVGVVVGTANVGELTISNITESGNTLTQTGKTAPVGQSNLYGRFVPGSTGKLVIDGYSVVLNQASLNTAIANGTTKVLLADGEYDLNGIQKDGLTLIGNGENVKVANTTKYASGKAIGAIWQAINLENVTITNTVYTMADGGKATFTNVNFAAGFRQGYGTGVVFTDCTFGANSEGFALHFQTDSASEGGLITLTGCKFEGGKVHLGGKRSYSFADCEFAAGTDFQVWSNITLNNCTVNGEKITEDNVAAFFPNLNLEKVTIQ